MNRPHSSWIVARDTEASRVSRAWRWRCNSEEILVRNAHIVHRRGEFVIPIDVCSSCGSNVHLS
jgi:siroheme synthase (precorrin-2 oxidase/ferrochelatase)